MASTVHLIHGFLGSGKTTFAKQLERDTGGLRISLDDWTIGLSGDHVHLDPVLFQRVTRLMGDLWPRAVHAGVQDLILDFGFWHRAGRGQAREHAAEVGAEVKLYNLVCSDEVALRRCLARTDAKTADYHIDADAFEALRRRFEPLDVDEPAIEVVTG